VYRNRLFFSSDVKYIHSFYTCSIWNHDVVEMLSFRIVSQVIIDNSRGCSDCLAGTKIFQIIGVRAEARRLLWNEIRFCERATATSRAYKSDIIKADHSDRYEGAWLLIKTEMSRCIQWIANWRISQCKHFQMKLPFPSINRALRGIYHFVVHRGLLWYVIVEHVSESWIEWWVGDLNIPKMYL
jgi:hypothetical protein